MLSIQHLVALSMGGGSRRRAKTLVTRARATTPPSKDCGQTGCELSIADRCCACLDTRPFELSGYTSYRDEHASRLTSRQFSYCPYCRLHPHRNPRSGYLERFPGLPKVCGHAHCLLEQQLCCTCSDLRPHTANGMYPLYLDGEGVRYTGERDAMYCTACHAWDAFATPPTDPIYRTRAPRRYRRRLKREVEAWRTIRTEQELLTTQELRPTQERQERQTYFSNIPAAYETAKRLKACGHNACTLTIDICCACSDHRPYQAGYEVYVDGRGSQKTGARHVGYCPTCRQIQDFSARSQPSTVSSHAASVSSQASSVMLHSMAAHTAQPANAGFGGSTSVCSVANVTIKTTTQTAGKALVKTCGHSDCSLTLALCCACSDCRPHEDGRGYEVYVDGHGFQFTGTRDAGYCPSCRESRDNSTSQGSADSLPSAAQTSATLASTVSPPAEVIFYYTQSNPTTPCLDESQHAPCVAGEPERDSHEAAGACAPQTFFYNHVGDDWDLLSDEGVDSDTVASAGSDNCVRPVEAGWVMVDSIA